jgi:flagellar protein FliJ
MKKSERLEPVIKVARNTEQNAAKALGESRRILEKNEAKLTELLNYRQEYSKKYEDTGRDGMEINRLNEFRQFLVRLNDAIASQRELIRIKQSELDRKNTIWRQTRVKHKSIDKIVTRHRMDEHNDDDRQQQGESDDHSQHVKPVKD